MSSSRIRRALAAGELEEARRLLDRPYRFGGQVVQRPRSGADLGWPTANLQVDGRKFLPAEGVYAAWAWAHSLQRSGRRQHRGIGGASCQSRDRGPQGGDGGGDEPGPPAHGGSHRPLRPWRCICSDRKIELEGRADGGAVELLRSQRIRGLEALVAQIGRDADQARQICAAIVPAQTPEADG